MGFTTGEDEPSYGGEELHDPRYGRKHSYVVFKLEHKSDNKKLAFVVCYIRTPTQTRIAHPIVVHSLNVIKKSLFLSNTL